jgi:hypothetical protein
MVSLHKSRKKEKETIKASLQHCEEELLQHMEVCSLRGDKSKPEILHNICKAEDIKKMFNKLRSICGKYQKSGVAFLEVPRVPGTDQKLCKDWKLVETPEEIMEYLLERNCKHFGQAKGTPFTTPPLSKQFNFQASTAVCEMVLEGESSCEELNDLTSILLHHFECRQQLDNLPSQMTMADLLDALAIWNEGTSTSPSVMNLGHYHVMFCRHTYEEDSPEAKAFKKKQAALLQAQLALLNYALRFNHSFDHQKTVVNVMIQKDLGNCKIPCKTCCTLALPLCVSSISPSWENSCYPKLFDMIHPESFARDP